MCGRFVQLPLRFPGRLPWPALADELLQLTERYNLAPTQRTAVLLDDAGNVAVRRLRWGLIPPWVKDLKQTYSTINARCETVGTKPAYRAAFKARRCVVPMAGYYEWVPTAAGKQPYLLTSSDGDDLFAAGIWEPRHALQDEAEQGSCSIITTTAADEAGHVHDRMPVFLPIALIEPYLRAGPDEAMQILMAAPPPKMAVRPVSKRVNAPRDDDAGLLEAVVLD